MRLPKLNAQRVDLVLGMMRQYQINTCQEKVKKNYRFSNHTSRQQNLTFTIPNVYFWMISEFFHHNT